MFDYLIVGAGFAGAVIAERLAGAGEKRVLVVDRRIGVGGNAADGHDAHGILVHRYGPHVFHTNSERIWRYVCRFTRWRPYIHRVRALVDGTLVPIPVNLDTINAVLGLELDESRARRFLEQNAIAGRAPVNAEEMVVSRVGPVLFAKLFEGYTRKHWGVEARRLDPSVTARLPVRWNRDDRYFSDRFQGIPVDGYSRLFERMLAHPQITVALGTDYRAVRSHVRHRHLIYTGSIDDYFDHYYGKLPYRSVEFRLETLDAEKALAAPVINNPGGGDWTRVTEFKALTGQNHPRTTLMREYPGHEGEPCYPIPRTENRALHRRYARLASAHPNVTFLGRLGSYQYLNMDQVIGQALSVFDRLSARREPVPA